MITNKEVDTMLIPPEWQGSFEISQLQTYPNDSDHQEWRLELVEKATCIPKQLKGKDTVLNGFMNSVEILDFPLRGKPMYLRFTRRRWKEKGTEESYHNEYTFHPVGMKATKEFGAFLKGLDRIERSEFFNIWPNLRHIREEDF